MIDIVFGIFFGVILLMIIIAFGLMLWAAWQDRLPIISDAEARKQLAREKAAFEKEKAEYAKRH